MRGKIYFIIFILFVFAFQAKGQIAVGVQGGLSYIEHVSTGVTVNFGKKHAISFLCGTNFFTKMNDFRNLFLQYEYSFTRWKVAGAVFHLGVKGGDSYFTDDYYRWHVIHAIPFAGLTRPLNGRTKIFLDAGAAFSFEQSVERIQQGEYGHYRELLPEIKIGMAYNLTQKK